MNKVFEKLEEIRAKKTCNKEKCDTKELCRICVVDDAIEIVKQEAEQYNNGWIPCSERLPEERETVLLQDFDGFYELGVCTVKCGIKGFEDGDWWSSANNFIAWQPLPQPYQNGE